MIETIENHLNLGGGIRIDLKRGTLNKFLPFKRNRVMSVDKFGIVLLDTSVISSGLENANKIAIPWENIEKVKFI
jgi:hypothetical protein